jgi:hypothetical protein
LARNLLFLPHWEQAAEFRRGSSQVEQLLNQGLEHWLLVARGGLLVTAFTVFAWALWRMRGENREELERVRVEQRAMAARTQELSERVQALATLVASLPRRAEPVLVEAPRAPAPVSVPRRDPGVRSYETAMRLARSGAGLEEIIASSGVTGSEARLLRRLHGAESRRGNAA